MKNILLFVTIINIIGLSNAQSPNWLWAKSAGGTYADVGRCVSTDANGNAFVTGTFDSPDIVFGNTTLTNAGGLGNTSDIFIVKYDLSGNVLWAKSAGAYSYDRSESISTDINGNCYITGNYLNTYLTFGNTTLFNNGSNTRDIFVVKYDALGNVVWANGAGSNYSDWASNVCTDINGNIYITGVFGGSSITFGNTTITNGAGDGYVVKYNSLGNVIWANNCGYGIDISTDITGNSYVVGGFSSPTITFWLTLGSITLANDTTNNTPDIFIVKYNVQGDIVWAKSAGGNYGDYGINISTDLNGNSYITGHFQSPEINFGTITLMNAAIDSSSDVFVAKYDSSGNVIWAKRYGGNSNDVSRSIYTDGTNNVYITGYFKSNSIAFGNTTLTNTDGSGLSLDMFVVKYDSSGNVLWATSTGADWGDGITTDANGNVFVTGNFGNLSNASFGNTTLTCIGGYDMFIAKLGNITGLKSFENTKSIIIYPNPTNGKFVIKDNSLIKAIEIYNIVGEKIYYADVNFFHNPEIDLSIQPSGIYIVRMESVETIYYQKLLKQ